MAWRSFANAGSLSQFVFDVKNEARDKTPPSNFTLRVPVQLACNDADTQDKQFWACPRLLYLHSIGPGGDAVNNSQNANICRIAESNYPINPLADGWLNKTITQVPSPYKNSYDFL